MATILHIAFVDQWEAARRAGSYRWSTRGKSLDDGATFIHASRPDQVAMVANFAYDDVTEPLCLLVIDTARLVSALCDEDLDGTGIEFPAHLRAAEPGRGGRRAPVPPGSGRPVARGDRRGRILSGRNGSVGRSRRPLQRAPRKVRTPQGSVVGNAHPG